MGGEKWNSADARKAEFGNTAAQAQRLYHPRAGGQVSPFAGQYTKDPVLKALTATDCRTGPGVEYGRQLSTQKVGTRFAGANAVHIGRRLHPRFVRLRGHEPDDFL